MGFPTMGAGVPPHFLVIVPGYMGSKLRDKNTGEIVWIDFKSVPLNPFKWGEWLDNLFDKMTYPNDDLEPAGIMEEVVFLPPWAKQEHYGRLIEALEEMGYLGDENLPEPDRNLYTFSYDWRQDNRISGRQLGEAVKRWGTFHPGAKAWLIGHSNGGIISRWYIEKEGGKDKVGRLFLMGSPWDGAPKALKMIFSGFDTFFRRGFDVFNARQRSRELIRSFPSAYQLLPVKDPFLRGLDNELVDVFNGQGWLEIDRDLRFLKEGKKFNEELGTGLSVETLCFFGRQLPTVTSGALKTATSGTWEDIVWASLEAGDGTVPERSAVHPHAAVKYPVSSNHGDIYIKEAVLDILAFELSSKFSGVSLTRLVTGKFTILFEPEKDVYAPGEPIFVWLEITENKGNPLPGRIAVRAELKFREALPGSAKVGPPSDPPAVRLRKIRKTPGRYEGTLPGPTQEGYYQVEVTVRIPGEDELKLDELVIVEALPQ